MYGEGGKISKWSRTRTSKSRVRSDEIVLRQPPEQFRHLPLLPRSRRRKKDDFKLGTRDMNGSKDVVELISKTPCAIGYSGMGYATPDVKVLKVAKKKGEKADEPSIEDHPG